MKKNKNAVIQALAIIFMAVSVASCGSMATTALRAYEVLDQSSSTNGVYLGNASSYSDAQSLARSKGYSRFDWYSTTGDVFGYN